MQTGNMVADLADTRRTSSDATDVCDAGDGDNEDAEAAMRSENKALRAENATLKKELSQLRSWCADQQTFEADVAYAVQLAKQADDNQAREIERLRAQVRRFTTAESGLSKRIAVDHRIVHRRDKTATTQLQQELECNKRNLRTSREEIVRLHDELANSRREVAQLSAGTQLRPRMASIEEITAMAARILDEGGRGGTTSSPSSQPSSTPSLEAVAAAPGIALAFDSSQRSTGGRAPDPCPSAYRTLPSSLLCDGSTPSWLPRNICNVAIWARLPVMLNCGPQCHARHHD